VTAARAAAYEPGQDFTDIFGLCAEPGPGAARTAAPTERAAPAVPAAPAQTPRSQWYMEPVKVFDNVYYGVLPSEATVQHGRSRHPRVLS